MIKDEVQQSICEQERRIRDLINEPRKRYTLIKKLGLWHQLCSCLDVIGDTELATTAYTAQKLGANKGSAYLAAYGLLQALFLQQDAIFNLCESLEISDNISNYPGLQKRLGKLEMPASVIQRNEGESDLSLIMQSHDFP